MKFFDQVSNYKIGLLQKIRRFQGRFVCKFPFFDRLRHFYGKMTEKKFCVKLQNQYNLKNKRFFSSIKTPTLYNDRIRHIYEK